MNSDEEDVIWIVIDDVNKKQVYPIYNRITKKQIDLLLRNIQSCFRSITFSYSEGDDGIVFYLEKPIKLNTLTKIYNELSHIEYHIKRLNKKGKDS